MKTANSANRRRLPAYLTRTGRDGPELHALKATLRRWRLHSVCESARCPNIGFCFACKTATFMIMGDVCTRDCRFCAVSKGKPRPIDPEEPERLARAAAEIGLKHVVVTSVTLDDLIDGGAAHFAAVVSELHRWCPEATVEILVPDFAGNRDSVELVARSAPHVFNHNLETVPRLYDKVRPQAKYLQSLEVLRLAREVNSQMFLKSGLMVGLGETEAELIQVMSDLRRAGCQILTVGQYLQPFKSLIPVERFYQPKEFNTITETAYDLGFVGVAAAPLVRSSFMAADLLSETGTLVR